VKFSVTGPLDGAQLAAAAVEVSLSEEPDEQAVMDSVDRSRIATERARSRIFASFRR
jgi:hypothetical protein